MMCGVWFSTKTMWHFPSSGQCYLDQEQARGEPSRSSSMIWMAGCRHVPSEAAVAPWHVKECSQLLALWHWGILAPLMTLNHT